MKNVEKIYDPKAEHIVRTLSRTRRKDYENYIINAIWNRLIAKGIADLKPVSQAYMRSDVKPDKYYLVDLYFPQLHIGIECDEGYHENNKDADKARKLDIQEMYRRIREEDYEALHVRVYKAKFEDIEKEIDIVVETISAKYYDLLEAGHFEAWIMETDPEQEVKAYFKNKDEITCYDEIVFPTLANACNTILGSNYRGVQRGFFYPKTAKGKTSDYVIWAPRLAAKQYGESELKTVGKYRNVLSDDGMSIHESCSSKSMRILKKDVKAQKSRLTFGYVKDPVTRRGGWKFLGVYQFDYSKSGANIYTRVDDKFRRISQ